MPCCVEGVRWVFGFVGHDGTVELVFSDVALLGVQREDGRREGREGDTQGQTVSEMMEMWKLVILWAVARKATMMDAGG